MSSFNMDEIVPNLWQGSEPPFGSRLKEMGFSVLVLCAKEFQPPASDFGWLTVIHAPNDDDPDYPLDRSKLKIALDAARQVSIALNNGHKVLVTCQAGMNRSGLVNALALHIHYGWPGEECLRVIRKKRRSYQGWKPLFNQEFVAAILKLPEIAVAALYDKSSPFNECIRT